MSGRLTDKQHDDYLDFLSTSCSRLKHRKCYTRACMMRGGWDGSVPLDFNSATCIPYEIWQTLNER